MKPIWKMYMNPKTKELQEYNHIIAEAFTEGMSALERAKSELSKESYRNLKAAISKSYSAGREVVKLSEKRL